MRTLVALAALAIVVLTCSDSHASSRRVRTTSNQAAVSTYPQSSGPFSRLMEMERRKNAALRSMFFGR